MESKEAIGTTQAVNSIERPSDKFSACSETRVWLQFRVMVTDLSGAEGTIDRPGCIISVSSLPTFVTFVVVSAHNNEESTKAARRCWLIWVLNRTCKDFRFGGFCTVLDLFRRASRDFFSPLRFSCGWSDSPHHTRHPRTHMNVCPD